MLRERPERVSVIAEGDSWFAFPKKNVIGRVPRNIVDWFARWGGSKLNLLELASNGDELLTMTSGSQQDKLAKALRRFHERGTPVDLLLFSGGGNDMVGDWRLDRLLLADASAATKPAQCFDQEHLETRLAQLRRAYENLLDLVDRYSPSTRVVSHVYDVPHPDGREAKFLKGAVRRGPWLQPHLSAAKVRPRLRRAAVRYLLKRFAAELAGLESARFRVARTQRTLTNPDYRKEWGDEMHPTSAGFEPIAAKVYQAARQAAGNRLPPL